MGHAVMENGTIAWLTPKTAKLDLAVGPDFFDFTGPIGHAIWWNLFDVRFRLAPRFPDGTKCCFWQSIEPGWTATVLNDDENLGHGYPQ
jgi:hypothetical protein